MYETNGSLVAGRWPELDEGMRGREREWDVNVQNEFGRVAVSRRYRDGERVKRGEKADVGAVRGRCGERFCDDQGNFTEGKRRKWAHAWIVENVEGESYL